MEVQLRVNQQLRPMAPGPLGMFVTVFAEIGERT
jgi:hypothetical protein